MESQQTSRMAQVSSCAAQRSRGAPQLGWVDPSFAFDGGLGGVRPASSHGVGLEAASARVRAAELEAENHDLRTHARALEERLALTPAQAVQRLQGEVAAIESRMLEQQMALQTGARKAEITLRSELDVSRHEVAQLRQALESKNGEVVRYQHELEEIIEELSRLRGLA